MAKSKKIKKQLGKGSSTEGIKKGMNCQKTPRKVRLAKDSRFYKTDPLNYLKACEETNRLN